MFVGFEDGAEALIPEFDFQSHHSSMSETAHNQMSFNTELFVAQF